MRRYADVVLNSQGVPQTTATITVTKAATPAGSGALATIYSDDGITATSNPVSTDSNGRFAFYVADGRYDLKAQLNSGANYIVADQDITSLTEAALFDNVIAVDGKQYLLNSAGLSAAITAAGSSGVVLITRPIVMTANVTSPSGVELRFLTGGSITTTGWTLTINGPLTAPATQIFIGTGTITFGFVSPGLRAVWFPGADIVAQINNAYAAAPAAPSSTIIYIDPPISGGCYSATSTASFSTVSKAVILQGVAGNGTTASIPTGTCINYTPTTATSMFTIDWQAPSGNSNAAGSGIRDLALINNNCVTNGGCGSSAIAVNVGPVNQGARRAMFFNLSIDGFGTGLQFNDSSGLSWGTHFLNCNFGHNTTGTSYPLSIGHENDVYTSCTWVSNGTGLALGGGDVYIAGGSFDSNTTTSVALTNSALLRTSGVHWENFLLANLVYMTGSVSTKWFSFGDSIADDTSGGSSASNWFSAGTIMVRSSGVNGGIGGRTYSGFIFNAGNRESIDVLTFQPATFPDATFCNPAICHLNVTDSTRQAGHMDNGGLIATGATPTVTGTGACSTISTQSGGAWNGAFKCTGTTGASTVTITLPNNLTAFNGWNCIVQDMTTRANLVQQTSNNTTSATLTATSITQNDMLAFSCFGY